MRSTKRLNRNYDVLVFRKWGRRNYSLFSTLKKTVNISVLSVTYLLAVPAAVSALPRDTAEVKMQYDLDEVEVTASRVPVLYSEVARVLSVIEAQEIERMPAESVQDLLEYVTGVDIRQRGAEGVQADISIRGGTFDQLLILLNGINMTDPQTGHHNLNLPVSLSDIERIEILEGPAARIYGPNAFSGAINIITRKPVGTSVSAQLSAGSYGWYNSELSTSFRTGSMGHLLSAGKKGADGYSANTDFGSVHAFYTGEWSSGSGKLLLQGGITEKGFGANSFYTPVYPNQYENVGALFGAARYETQGKVNTSTSVYWRRHNDTFKLFRDEAPDWYTNHNYHRTDVWGADVNSWFIWAGGKSSFGAGFRRESILSNVLGELMSERKDVPGKDIFYTHSKERSIASVFAEHGVFHDRWSLAAGIMANYISDNSTGINIFPGVDISYNLSEPLKLYASWNTSLRMPTFTDLYYSGPTNKGNPLLKPERSSAFEGGLKFNQQNLKGHVVLFHRTGKNLIDWVKDEDDELWSSMNHTKITSRGAELRLVYLPRGSSGSILPDKIEAGYLYNSQVKDEGTRISYYVLDNLRHKMSASVNKQLLKRLLVDLRFLFQDREGTFSFYDGHEFSAEKAYEPFMTVDAKLSYRFPKVNLFVSANNIFDTNYYDIGNIPQPGRWLKAGISVSLDKKH